MHGAVRRRVVLSRVVVAGGSGASAWAGFCAPRPPVREPRAVSCLCRRRLSRSLAALRRGPCWSEGPAQLPRRTRPLLSCVELHHVAAGGHPRSPIGSWNITSWWTRRLLAAALGRLIHVRVSLRGDGRCCPPELSIWHEAVRSRTDYASAPAALARRAASHLRGRGVARERWRRL